MPKYELTDTKLVLKNGIVLYQIRALKDIQSVMGHIGVGTLGGFVQSEHNLDQEGLSWIFPPAQVLGDWRVSGHTQVGGITRSSPQGLYGFPPESTLDDMLGDVPGQKIVQKVVKKLNRFQMLRKGL